MTRRSPRHGSTLWFMRLQMSSLMIAVALCAACESNDPPETPSPGPGVGDTITGRERIGWDQFAVDAAELATFRYAIYVDGARSVMSDVTCASAPTATGFPCTGPLPPLTPGVHRLEIAAFVNTNGVVEGARSPALQVTVAGATTPAAPEPLADGEQVVTADGVALEATFIADGLTDITDMAIAPDGRLVVSERGGCVRVFDGNGLVTACQRAAGEGVLGVALAPDFVRSGHLFLMQAAPGAFRLVRYRLAGNELVDRMSVLADVPAAADPAAAVRFGPDGKLYAAFDDAGRPDLAARLSEWSGKILRLNPDGRTPDDQPAGSPVFWSGLGSPGGLDWSPDGGTLWLADSGGDGVERIRALATGDELPRRASQRASYVLERGLDASALAFYRTPRVPKLFGDLFIAATDGAYLLRVRFDAGERTRAVTTEKLLEGRLGGLRAVVAGPDGALYVSSDTAVWRLMPTTVR